MRSILQTATNGLENSLDYYQRLGYKVLSETKPTLITEGQFVMEINPERFARPGVKMYQERWDKEMVELSHLTKITKIEGGHLLADPSGVWVYLLQGASPVTDDMKGQLSENSFGKTGNFAGLSLETTDMDRSATFWGILGFKKTMGSVEQGWIAYQDDSGMGVSLMGPNSCPHLFFNPSLTFFNGKKNEEIIQGIRDAGIPIAEEVTHFNKEGKVDNIILRDPGGWGMFLFND